ncbi:MAG: hypothetical protein IKI63_05475 [Clostridia bacterium]|nr:hypothetical protein [Clostridia bacterium]
MLGLMFFLLCFFVSAVLLASAAVNVSRASMQRREQQAYLSINAAAGLLQGEMAKLQGFAATETLVTHKCHICNAEYDYEIGGLTLKDETKPSMLLEPLNDMMRQLFLSRTKTHYEVLTDIDKLQAWENARSFDVSEWVKEFDILSDDMPTVHVRLTADSVYNIFAELSVVSDLSASFSMTMELVANCSVNPDNRDLPNACHHEQVEVVENGLGEWVTQVQNQYFDAKKTATNTVVSWEQVRFVKGSPNNRWLTSEEGGD